jgi:hypothetical protein
LSKSGFPFGSFCCNSQSTQGADASRYSGVAA